MPDNDHSTSSATPRPRATVVIGDYELGAQIGRGSFATVYRGVNKRTNSLVAIKSVVRSSLTRRLLENLETEINILRTIKHESIVELIDCLKSRNHIHLVMEYCSLGDLAGYMRKRKEHPALRNAYGGLSMHIVRSFVSQLGSAMLFLRSRDVIHRDIKTQNILLQPPTVEGYVLGESEARGEVPWIKVADFGFARNLPSTALAETLCGSPLYMAPEILHYEPYDAKADLWSIGAVIYEMMTGKPPFHASNHVELARVIERTNDNISFPDEKQQPTSEDSLLLDSTLKDLVRKLLKMNPGARMSFADFFAHPALKWRPDNGELVAQLPVAEAQAVAKASAERPLTPSAGTMRKDAIYNHHQHHRYVQQTTRAAHHTDAHDQAAADMAQDDMANAMRNMDIRQDDRVPRNAVPSSDYQTTAYPPTSRRQQQQQQQQGASLDDGYSIGTDSHRRHASLTEEDQALAEREYVVIEKRAVEMNYLADELNSSPRTPSAFYPPRPTGALQQAPGVARQMTALARAIHDAVSSQYQISTEAANGPLSRRSGGRGVYAGVFNPLDVGLAETFESRHTLATAQEEPTIRRMEGLAYKAHSMGFLADTKWRVIADRTGTAKKPRAADALTDPEGGYLSPSDVSIEEAFVLYLRALSLLHRAMIEASRYWAGLHRGASSQSSAGSSSSTAVTVSAAFNGAVQWVRDKFNECLDRAEALKQRASGDELDSVSQISIVQILYEQALALSKVAAQRELKWIEPLDCDRAYQLAIWMLSAILEATDSGSAASLPEEQHREMPDAYRDAQEELALEDRTIVEQFIASIVKRRETLQRRLMQLEDPSATV